MGSGTLINNLVQQQRRNNILYENNIVDSVLTETKEVKKRENENGNGVKMLYGFSIVHAQP